MPDVMPAPRLAVNGLRGRELPLQRVRDLRADSDRLLRWYAESARDLPWRAPGTPAWHILVSEVMLQQTPVVRVLPAWERWCARWPTPAALNDDPPGEAVLAW